MMKVSSFKALGVMSPHTSFPVAAFITSATFVL